MSAINALECCAWPFSSQAKTSSLSPVPRYAQTKRSASTGGDAGSGPDFPHGRRFELQPQLDVSTLAGKNAACTLLRTRGLIRVAIAVPANADYKVVSVNNQYGCNESDVISMYRRLLPTTNLRFLSAVMFDGRESSPATGTTKILYSNFPDSLLSDLAHQSLDPTNIHAQGDGTRPTPAQQQQTVNFEMGLLTAQATGHHRRPTGRARRHGRTYTSRHPAVLYQRQFQRQLFSSDA